MQEYARLAVRIGANIQEGDVLMLNAPVECAAFARLITIEAYEAGAKDVVVKWTDDVIGRLRYQNASDEVFDVFPEWEKLEYDTLAAGSGFARIAIYAQDPEALAGIDPDRIRRASAARNKSLKDFYDKLMRSEFSWCLVSVPVLSWAKKVFPDYEDDEAMDALWNAIYETLRIDGSGDAVEKWKTHTQQVRKWCEWLNGLNLRTLHYTSGLGTDFTVGLPEHCIWCGGSEKNKKGVEFIANMPTEEIFTAPHKYGGSGVLAASRPLCLNGNLIQGIRFTVENGRIVKAEADKGLEVLEQVLDMDEGSRYLGEVALVEYDSPISNQNLLYYNTLFDENAACHIAFGAAYPECVEGGCEMTKEELEAAGLNDSDNHEDFMIGTADLQISGITEDGREVQIFRDGNFVC